MSYTVPTSRWRRGLGTLQAVIAWFIVYVAVGGLLGFAVRALYTDVPSCMPYNSVFALIVSSCPYPLVDWFWFATLGLPRVVIVLPALAIGIARSNLLNEQGLAAAVLSAVPYLVASLPFFAALIIGGFHLFRRHSIVAALTYMAIFSQVLVLGFLA